MFRRIHLRLVLVVLLWVLPKIGPGIAIGADTRAQLVVHRSRLAEQIVASDSQGLGLSRAFQEIFVWDLPGRSLLRTIPVSTSTDVSASSRSPRMAVVRSSRDGTHDTVVIYDLLTGGESEVALDAAFYSSNRLSEANLSAVALNRDSTRCAVAAVPTQDRPSRPCVFTLSGTVSRFSQAVPSRLPLDLVSPVQTLVFDASDNLVLMTSNAVYQTSTDGSVSRVRALEDKDHSFCLSLALGGRAGEYAVLVANQPGPPSRLGGTRGAYRGVSQRVRCHSPRGNLALDVPREIVGSSVDMTPDGFFVFLSGSSGVMKWDLRDGRRVEEFRFSEPGHGRVAYWRGLLLVESAMGMQFLDAASGAEIQTFGTPSSMVRKLYFDSSLGRLLVLDNDGLSEWNLSGRLSLPVWGGPVSRELFRVRSRSTSGEVCDVAHFGGITSILMEGTKDGVTPRRDGRLILRRDNEEHTVSDQFDGEALLSDDGSLSFFQIADKRDVWQAYDNILRRAGTRFKMGFLLCENHSPGKPKTVLGFPGGLFDDLVRCVNLETGKRIWTVRFGPTFWQISPSGSRLVLADRSLDEVLVVKLDTLEPPTKATVSGFAAVLNDYREHDFSEDECFLHVKSRFKAVAIDCGDPLPIRDRSGMPSTIFGYRRERLQCNGGGLGFRVGRGLVEVFDNQSSAMIGELHGSVMGFTGVVPEDREWIITLKSGWYAASRRGSEKVSLGLGRSAISFDQIDLRRHRPDAVLRELGLAQEEDIRPFEDRVDRRLIQFRSNEVARGVALIEEVPEVSLPAAAVTREAVMMLEVATPAGSQWHSVILGLDDKDLAVGPLPRNSSGVVAEGPLRFEVPLHLGDNFVSFRYASEDGRTSVARRVVIRRLSLEAPADLYVLSVGVSAYRDRQWRLSFADRDASDFADFWLGRGRFGGSEGTAVGWRREFGSIKSLVLTNESATAASLEKMRQFVNQTSAKDLLLVFFSGHGIRDSRDAFFFAPHDMDFMRPAALGISDDAMVGLLEAAPSRRKVLLIDACNSGEIEETTSKPGSEEPPSVFELFRDVRPTKRCAILAATRGREQALEDSRDGNGVFLRAILQGVQFGRADLDRDERIGYRELSDFVIKEVQETSGRTQKPFVRRSPMEEDILLIDRWSFDW